MRHERLCTGYIGAPSPFEAIASHDAAEHLQTAIARVAALATVAASGETDFLPRHLHAELLRLLAELAQSANDAADELLESLAEWPSSVESRR
ncbi:hypothetical protein AYM40_16460 [Paraburkholderia phytofirmans OLGA172]|uniref:Uncharacterized protein n=1 Tax=Paraburkholderia phytofirmans OLGA172 TaxID=1417228 RepID=A0A167W393_9BURK|nr:hypothetical protein [Paraburkholderia phytofirmans]ANB73773.1 hypothetical protein AYM40_16460 [Paraburkholderia phytofirmans OLGA172]